MHHEHLFENDKLCSLNQPAEHVEHLISSNSKEGGAHPLNICRVNSCEPNQELCFSHHLVSPLLFVEICSEGVSYCVRSNLVSVSVQILDLERENSQRTDSVPREREQLAYRFWNQRERTVSVQILVLEREQLAYRFWTQREKTVIIQILDLERESSQRVDSGPRERKQLSYRFWTQPENSQRTQSGPRQRTVAYRFQT